MAKLPRKMKFQPTTNRKLTQKNIGYNHTVFDRTVQKKSFIQPQRIPPNHKQLCVSTIKLLRKTTRFLGKTESCSANHKRFDITLCSIRFRPFTKLFGSKSNSFWSTTKSQKSIVFQINHKVSQPTTKLKANQRHFAVNHKSEEITLFCDQLHIFLDQPQHYPTTKKLNRHEKSTTYTFLDQLQHFLTNHKIKKFTKPQKC